MFSSIYGRVEWKGNLILSSVRVQTKLDSFSFSRWYQQNLGNFCFILLLHNKSNLVCWIPPLALPLAFSLLEVNQLLSWLTKNPYLLFSFSPFSFLAVVASLYHLATTDRLSSPLISLHPHLPYWLPFQHISPVLCEERCGDGNSVILL